VAKPRPLHSLGQTVNIREQALGSCHIGDISQEAIGDFWRQKDYISSRSHLKGLNYALEGYIDNFIVEKVDEMLQLQAKMYRSQCKPHIVALTVRI